MEPLALLLACAGVALCATAHAQEHCDSQHLGDTSENERGLEQRMEPGDLFLVIDTDVCGDAELVGIEVKACDTDRAPRVFLRPARGLVVREGALASTASIYTNVFCAADSDTASHESLETEQPLSPEDVGVTFEATTLALQSSSTPAPPESTKSLPVIQLQSRFSAKDQAQLPQVPSSQPPRFQDVWRPQGSLTDISVPLGKRLSRLPPGPPVEWIANRTPAWLQQPMISPPLPWLMRRSNTDWNVRKYMSSYGKKHATDYILQDSYPQSSYDDVLSLHWSEHGASPKSTITAPFIYHRFSRRPKYTQSLIQNKGSPAYIIYEHTSPTSAKHVIHHQLEVASPIHEEYPDLLTEWKYSHKTQRQVLPTLLQLLQDRNHPSGRMCASAHSVEDSETWWSDLSTQSSVPWLPDYSTDYSAMNVDSWGSYYLPRQQTDTIDRWKLSNLSQRLQFPTVFNEESSDSTLSTLSDNPAGLEQLPWCPKCHPVTPSNVHKQHRQHHVTFQHSVDTLPGGQYNVDTLPGGQYNVDTLPGGHYIANELTERPLTTPAVHHSLSWLKNVKLLLAKEASTPIAEVSSPAFPVEPWTLSRLLLARPTFREVIRI